MIFKKKNYQFKRFIIKYLPDKVKFSIIKNYNKIIKLKNNKMKVKFQIRKNKKLKVIQQTKLNLN